MDSEEQIKTSIADILYKSKKSSSLAFFTKSGNPNKIVVAKKPSKPKAERSAPKAKVEPKVDIVKDQEMPAHVSESEPEFSNSASSDVEDVPMNKFVNINDDDSFDPGQKKVEATTLPTRSSRRQVKRQKLIESESEIDEEFEQMAARTEPTPAKAKPSPAKSTPQKEYEIPKPDPMVRAEPVEEMSPLRKASPAVIKSYPEAKKETTVSKP
jgi:hypothetical protein